MPFKEDVGLAIFPAVFAFGIDPAGGPELAFITLPGLFAQIPGGRLIGTLFFSLLAAAALTSMFSILKVPAAYLTRRLSCSRQKATLLAAGLSFVAGLPPALGFGVFKGITIGEQGLLDSKLGTIWLFCLRYLGPAVMLTIFIAA